MGRGSADGERLSRVEGRRSRARGRHAPLLALGARHSTLDPAWAVYGDRGAFPSGFWLLTSEFCFWLWTSSSARPDQLIRSRIGIKPFQLRIAECGLRTAEFQAGT